MKLSHILATTLAVMTLASCSKWLDVKPSDRISENVNFSTLPGFKQALNGIYVELNTDQLYGRSLSCEFIEIMAQRYAIAAENKTGTEIMNLSLGGSTAKTRIESIWGKAYNLIANANLIIDNCETHREVLPDEYYHLIKGEAYALRAYLHFDLYRLFAAPYDPAATSDAIPYYDQFKLDVNPTLSSHEYLDKVIADLKVAEEELQDDPIVRLGVMGNAKDVFLSYRNLRLNLYAVQALLARVYYYMSYGSLASPADETYRQLAYEYAKKIITVQELRFPWVNATNILTASTIDHVFSSEIIFALQNLNRESLYNSYFNANTLKPTSLLGTRNDVVTQIYGGARATKDIRYRANFGNTVNVGSTTYKVFTKYQGTDSLYCQMIPMIRATEAYLIVAELAPDDQERLDVFNTYREHRGIDERISDITELGHSDLLNTALDQEWIREFYGEGQLLYWYKRNRCINMRSATDPTGYGLTSVPYQSKYILAIPDGETKYN